MSDVEADAVPPDFPGLTPDVVKPAREGLPPGYRMRANPQYVEQLSDTSGPMPLRLVPVSAIDRPEAVERAELDPLIRSIRALGVLHPLLVRGGKGRYQLIAGRRRLLAAQAAGLTAVPCFVHHVEGEQAALLAHADNRRHTPRSTTAADDASSSDRSADVLAQLSSQFSGILSAERLLTDGDSLGRRPALDLIQVHTAVARWLIQATQLLKGPADPPDQKETLGALVDGLALTAAPLMRLTGAPLRVQLDDAASSTRVNRIGLSTGLMGAILAVLPFVDVDHGGTLTLAAVGSGEWLTLDLRQSPTLLEPALAGCFFDSTWTSRPGGWLAGAGALALQTAVKRLGGTVACEVRRPETLLRIMLPARH